MTTSNGSITKWKEQLVNLIVNNIINPRKEQSERQTRLGIHLAIFTEPFLSLLFEGKKTIESRFSINKTGPYHKVKKGDIILIKKSGGPVCGYFLAGKVFYFLNTKKKIEEIRVKYSTEICAGSVKKFWDERKNTKFITLIEVKSINAIDPISIDKKDRTAWVTLRHADPDPTV